MYKVYKITRIDEIGYDQYDSCVIVAKNEQDALNIASKNYYIFTKNNTRIIEIKLDKSKPTLGSFVQG